MAVAAGALCLAGLLARWRRNASIARPRQRRRELIFHHGLDELAHAIAHARFDRIKPIVVENVGYRLGCRLHGIRLRGMARHGVVSCPAL
jgi:hypothetical protein